MKVLLAVNGQYTDVFKPGSPYVEDLVKRFPQCEFRCFIMGEESLDDIAWADVITGHPTSEQLRAAVNLKWLHIQSAGVNGYEKREYFLNPNTLVTRTADVFGVSMAEHAISMMLALNRLLPTYILQGHKHIWKHYFSTVYEICDSTVLLLGTGNLASEIVKRLKGFSCKIIGVRRDTNKPAPGYDEIYSSADLHKALSKADYIVSSLPHTPNTQKMLSFEEFSVMKPRAMVFNIGRGTTIDTEALIDALKTGKIAGAGIDVTDPEPLNADSPLWDMENVIVTPHSSGYSTNTHIRRFECFVNQLDKFLKSETLDHLVDFDAGY